MSEMLVSRGPRIREGIRLAKARGVVMGNPRLREAQARGRVVRQRNANEFARTVAPIIRQILQEGGCSYRAIARKLNALGVETRRGRKWTVVQVTAVLRRADT